MKGTARTSNLNTVRALTIAFLMIFLTLSVTAAWTRSPVAVRADGEGVWISTDKQVYSPEEVVIISGGGFLPSSAVFVQVIRPDSVMDSWPLFSDESGGFTTSYQLDGITGTYLVSASDGENTATVEFTDPPRSWSVGISPTTATVAQGSSTTAAVSVTASPTGGPSVDLSATGQPPGVTISFSPTSGTADFGSTMTVNVGSGATVGGPYTITVRVTTGAPGSESVKATTTFALTVTQAAQYYITVTSPYGSPTASAWVNRGDDFTASVTSPDVVAAGHRWGCTGYRIDGGSLTAGTSHTFIDVEADHTIAFEWQEQWYITITSAHGSPTEASQWVNDGDPFSVSVTTPDVVTADQDQWVLTGLTLDGTPQTLSDTVSFDHVHASHTILFEWTEQFYLTVDTNPAGLDSPTGEGWYNEGVTAHVSTAQYVDIVPGSSRYSFDHWDVASGTYSDATVVMDSAKTATANYVTQYYLTVVVDPLGLTTISGEGWYNEGDNPELNAPGVWGYTFLGWDVDGTPVAGNPINVYMDDPHTATAHYKRLVTRSQGFWATHYEFTLSVWGSDDVTIGVSKHVNSIGTLFGAFWSNIPYMSNSKTKRSSLDQARMQLLQQLVAAMLNVKEFGDDDLGTGASLIAAGKAAFAGTNRGAIISAAGALAGFNSWGDGEPLPAGVVPGSANPQRAQSMANRVYWDTLP